MRPLVLIGLIAAVFLVMLGSATLPELVLAFALGWTLRRGMARGREHGSEPVGPAPSETEPTRRGRTAIAALPRFLVASTRELFRGTWGVLLVLTGRRDWRNVGIVDLPLGERSPRGAAISALLTNVSPGSVALEIDDERRVMRLNVIDASDPDAVREALQRFYEDAQRPLFP